MTKKKKNPQAREALERNRKRETSFEEQVRQILADIANHEKVLTEVQTRTNLSLNLTDKQQAAYDKAIEKTQHLLPNGKTESIRYLLMFFFFCVDLQ